MSSSSPQAGGYRWNVVKVLALLFVFMSAVNMMGAGFRLMEDTSRRLLGSVTGNPFAALMLGVLATSIIQSSSVTTCIVVGLVSEGQITIEGAVPLVMGANIGTTITCSLVSLGYVSRRGRFQRAFSAATMHDFFNFSAVALLLPVELKTGLLSRAGNAIAGLFRDVTRFDSPKSPLKAACSCPAQVLERLLLDKAHLGAKATSIVLAILGLALLFFSLYYLTRNLKSIVSGRMESVLDKYLFRTAHTALIVGFIFTMVVQSSSVTTSLMVPLVTAGVITHFQAFPYVMGAHVGTTVTAFMASLAMGNAAGLAISLVHTLYNVIGVAIFFPVRRIRAVPVRLARSLGAMTLRSRWYALGYILVVFFALPILVIWLFG